MGGSAVIGTAFVAARGTRAVVADHAARADAIDGLRDVDLVSRADLLDDGTASVHWLNLQDRPVGVDDSDDGNVTGIGANLVLVGTTLSVGPLDGAAIADGSVVPAQIADEAVQTSHLAGLTGADFANGALTGADLAPGTLSSANVQGTRVNVRPEARGCARPDALTKSSTCTQIRGVCAVGSRANCSTGVCETGTPGTCSDTPIGQLLFAP